jgi:hypothetical protein
VSNLRYIGHAECLQPLYPSSSQARERPHAASVFSPKLIGMQVGDPLFSVLSDAQIADGFLNVNIYMVPVKFSIVFAQVPGRFVPELGVEPEFLEFVEKSRALLDATGVAELADEVSCPYKTLVSLYISPSGTGKRVISM